MHYWRLTFGVLLVSGVLRGTDALLPLDIRDVKVGGEIGRRIDVTVRNNILVLDVDKEFVSPFVERTKEGGYIGFGKLLMATARFAAYTQDPQVKQLHDSLVSQLLATQGDDGYLGMFRANRRIQALWDIHETGYLIAGLLADWHYFKKEASLNGARRAAGYLMANWHELPTNWGEQSGVAEHVGVTGVERTFLELHRATGEARYLDFVLRQRGLGDWDLPIIIGRKHGIEGHIYAYAARSLAQLELFRLQPRPALLKPAERALAFLTRGEGASITGGAGQWEIWTDDQDGRGALAETCATAYQLRLYDSLLRMRGESWLGDLMERTIYNTLFGAQSPEGRKIRYYTPVEGPRTYHPGDTYCCPGNYRRIVAELPEFLYYRTAQGITVNLYAESEAKLQTAGATVRLKQESAYPSQGTVKLTVDPGRPSRFALQLRIPAWASGATVKLNDEAGANARPGTFHRLERTWRPGDTVQLNLPLKPRLVEGRQRQAGRVAVMRGPIVFCLRPSQQPALAKLDAADLTAFTIDPGMLEVVPDDSVRQGGVAIVTGAWKPGYSVLPKPEMMLRLTEFADPEGIATYFRVRDRSVALPDELFGARIKR
jgi:uncharacterized protein